MKIIKTANGRTKMRFSKEDWLRIGYDAKWLKVAKVNDEATYEDEQQAIQSNFHRSVKDATDFLISLPSPWAQKLGEKIKSQNETLRVGFPDKNRELIVKMLDNIEISEFAQDPWRDKIYKQIKYLKGLCDRS